MSKSDLVGATEAAEIIGVSRSRVNFVLKNGQLKGRKISGEFWAIERSEAERYRDSYRPHGVPFGNRNKVDS